MPSGARSDGGRSYQPRATRRTGGTPAPYLGDQGWYGNAIWAGDPTDENLVDRRRHRPVAQHRRRRPPGRDQHLVGYPRSAHADQHAIVAHPSYDGASNRTVFFGNDGGICRRTGPSGGRPGGKPPYLEGWTGLDNAFGVTQFYAGAGNTRSGKIIGGAQDNGTLCFDPPAGPEGGATIFGGDGGWCASDPTDPTVFYGEYVFLNIHRNTDGGASHDTRATATSAASSGTRPRRQWDWKPRPFQYPRRPVAEGAVHRAVRAGSQPAGPDTRRRTVAVADERRQDAQHPYHRAELAVDQEPDRDLGEHQGSRSARWPSPGRLRHGLGGSRQRRALPDQQRHRAAPPPGSRSRSGPFPPQRYCTLRHDRPDPAGRRLRGVRRVHRAATSGSPATAARRGPTCPPPCLPRRCGRWPCIRGAPGTSTRAPRWACSPARIPARHWSPTNEGPTNCSVDDLFWMGETLVSVTHGRGMYRIDLAGM